MRFFSRWRTVRRIQLHADRGWRRRRWGLELSGIFSRQRRFHEIHPNWKRRAGACFFISQGFLFVVAHPHPAGSCGRKSNKPCIGEVVGGTGFSSQRIFHAGSGNSGSMLHNFLQHGGHNPRRPRRDYFFHLRKIFLQHAAIVVGHLGDVAGSNAHAIVGKYAVSGRLLERGDFGRTQRNGQIRRNVDVMPKRCA